MGGSIGLRLKAFPNPPAVVGFGRTEATLARAKERGAIDSYSLDPAAAVRDCDLVILCAPVKSIPDQMSAIAPGLAEGAIVTDVGSTKVDLTAEAEKRLPAGARFVGSHPMAGSERDGIEHAEPALYEQAVVVVTPSESADEAALLAVKDFWRSLGAVPVVLPASTHDRIVASISHLPHVVAALLVNVVAMRAERTPRTWDLAAGGFRDTTRIASSSPSIWRDICLTNRAAILEAVDETALELAAFRKALEAADAGALTAFFEKAREGRTRIPPKGRGLLPSIHDLFVEATDRPGIIAAVTGLLADAGVNIIDIEVTRVRESRGTAPIRILFETDNARARAAELLAQAGYTVRGAS